MPGEEIEAGMRLTVSGTEEAIQQLEGVTLEQQKLTGVVKKGTGETRQAVSLEKIRAELLKKKQAALSQAATAEDRRTASKRKATVATKSLAQAESARLSKLTSGAGALGTLGLAFGQAGVLPGGLGGILGGVASGVSAGASFGGIPGAIGGGLLAGIAAAVTSLKSAAGKQEQSAEKQLAAAIKTKEAAEADLERSREASNRIDEQLFRDRFRNIEEFIRATENLERRTP